MKNDYIPPPLVWQLASTVGGVITAIALIISLEYLSAYLKRSPQTAPTRQSAAYATVV